MEEERKDWYGSWTEIGVGDDDGPLQASSPFSRDSCEPAVLTWSHSCTGDKDESR